MLQSPKKSKVTIRSLLENIIFVASLLPLSCLIVLKLWDYKEPLQFFFDFKFYFYFCVPLLAYCLLYVCYRVRSQADRRKPENFREVQIEKFSFFVPISAYFIPFISSNFSSINDWFVVAVVVLLVGFLVIHYLILF